MGKKKNGGLSGQPLRRVYWSILEKGQKIETKVQAPKYSRVRKGIPSLPGFMGNGGDKGGRNG